MMKFGTLRIATIAALAVLGGSAHAADATDPTSDYSGMGFYLRADAGWSFLEWSGGDDDNAGTIGGGVGYQWNENLRTDVRLDWSGEYDIAPGADMSITTLTGNIYLDLPNDTMFTPYVGAGAGYGWAEVDGGSDKDGLALALGVGVAVGLSDNLDLDVGYRFVDVMSNGADPMEHQVTGGFRFKF